MDLNPSANFCSKAFPSIVLPSDLISSNKQNSKEKLDCSISKQNNREKIKKNFLSKCNCRSSLKYSLLVILLITLILLAILIFLAIKPCLLKKCHKNASVCIDRFPFWAQCICDRGYAGNGRSHCVECGISYVQPNLERIVGGKDSLKSSWPFAVYIIQTYQGQYDIKGSSRLINFSWVCGGTILNQRIILTAAHCIQDKFFGYEDEQGNSYTLEIQWNQWYSNVESTLEVYAGVNDIRNINKSQRLPVKRVNKHEQFNEYTLLNDVAIIELNENIESRFDIQFACLPNSSSTVYPEVNRSAFIIGWGRTSENGYPSSVLQNSKIKIFQADKCSRIEVDVEKNWDSQICAGSLDGSRDTCQGDSGGGLFVTEFLEPNQSQYFVSGIVSYGDGCARVGKPGVYSRVSYFLDWIRKHSDF